MAIEGGSRFASQSSYTSSTSLDEARRAAVERKLRKAGMGRDKASAIASMVGAVVGGTIGGVIGIPGGPPGIAAGVVGGAGLGAGLGAGGARIAQGDPGRGVPLLIGGLTAGAAGYAGVEKASKPRMDTEGFKKIMDTGFFSATPEKRREIWATQFTHEERAWFQQNPELSKFFSEPQTSPGQQGY